MDWLILILGVPAILIPLVLLFGFAGCSAAGRCADDSDCPVGTHCGAEGVCFADADASPSAPQNLAATARDDHSVSLTWRPADPATTDFGIERAEEGDDFTAIPAPQDLSATGATDTSGLLAGVTYTYRFSADPSDTSQATVFPAVPANLLAAPAKIDQIKVSWDNASAIATDYILEHRVVPGGTFGEIFRGPDTTFTHSRDNDPTLVEGSRHQYRVSAIVVDGAVENDVPQEDGVKSAASAIASVRLVFTDAFTAPLGTLTTESDASGFCIVQRLSQALLTAGGTQVRIVLRGPNTGSLTIDRITISKPAPSQPGTTVDPYDADSDLTDVAGVNVPPNTPVTIAANTAVTVGPVDYALDANQDLLVAFDIRSGNVLFGGLTGAFFFSNAATAEAGAPDRTTNYQNQTADTLSLIEIIQVL
jgi:hypothetical protein